MRTREAFVAPDVRHVSHARTATPGGGGQCEQSGRNHLAQGPHWPRSGAQVAARTHPRCSRTARAGMIKH